MNINHYNGNSNTITQSPPNAEKDNTLAAKQKIYRFMLKFQVNEEKLLQLSQDLTYLQNHILNSETENLLARYLKKKWPVIDSALKADKKDPLYELKENTRLQVTSLFNLIKSTYPEKTFVIDKELEGSYGRKIPQVKIISKANLGSTLPLYFIALPNEGMQKKTPLPIKHQEEADFLVKALSKIEEIAWNYKQEGCYTRAILACQLLEYMDIPRSSIRKVEARGSLSWHTETDRIPEKSRKWVSHIAPMVISESGERYVIDPSTNSNRALSLEEWKGLLGQVRILEESPPTNTFENLGKNAEDRNRKLEEASFAGYKKMYSYRQLSRVPFHSKTRAFLQNLL